MNDRVAFVVRLDKDLHSQLKQRAVDTDVPMADLIREGVARLLAGDKLRAGIG